MMLLTKAIKNKMPELYATDGIDLDDKIVAVKFFTPDSNWTWFIFEGGETTDGDWEFFGMVHGMEKEMGNFHLSEIMKVRGGLGLPVERDISATGMTYGQLKNR